MFTFWKRHHNSVRAGQRNRLHGSTRPRVEALEVRRLLSGFGHDTIGVYDPPVTAFYLNNSFDQTSDYSIPYGAPGALPVVGDWNRDGIDTLGYYSNGTFYLRNSNTPGPADVVIPNFGWAGCIPVAGDWNNDGWDTVGVYGTNAAFYLDNNFDSYTDVYIPNFGWYGCQPVAGDWNGDGRDTVGVYGNNQTFYLDNELNNTTDLTISDFGWAGCRAVAGDWDGDGRDSVGVYGTNATFYLDNNYDNTTDIVSLYGVAHFLPVVGNWDGSRGSAYVNRQGTLLIGGSSSSDAVSVEDDSVGSGVYVTFNSRQYLFPGSELTTRQVVFDGRAGWDNLDASRSSLRLKAYGSSGNDVLVGGSAADTLIGGSGKDKLSGRGGDDYLYGGDEAVVNSGTDPDELSGEAGRDTLWGGGGNDRLDGGSEEDVLRGEDGKDTLLGQSGGDNLYGGTGNDVLYGAASGAYSYADGLNYLMGEGDNDNLYGGNGPDNLFGGDGLDGLFGGQGVDHAWGGAGIDRYLDYTWVVTSGIWPVTWDTRYWQDVLHDRDAGTEALIGFENGKQTSVTFAGQTGTYTFAAGTWADGEVALIDSALAVLHGATANTRLLRRTDGSHIFFDRYGNLTNSSGGTFSAAAWNSGGRIAMPNAAFGNDNLVRETVLHEVGHNWYGRNATGWQALSGWTTADRSRTPGFTQGTDATTTWWYVTGTLFVSTYAMTNPNEDFAESFADYFMNLGGFPDTFTTDVTAIANKKAFLDQLVADLSR